MVKPRAVGGGELRLLQQPAYQLAVSCLLVLIAGLVLLFAPRSQLASVTAPVSVDLPLLLLFALLAASAALHRPLAAASLGLGTLYVPLAVEALGALPTAWLAGAASLLAGLGRRLLDQSATHPLPERRQSARLLVAASRLALAALVGGLVWTRWLVATELTQQLLGAMLGGATYLGVLLAGEAVESLLRGRRPIPRLRSYALPLSVDLASGLLGAVLTFSISLSQFDPAWLLLPLLSILSFEAARNASQRDGLMRRLVRLEAVGHAGRRIAGDTSELDRVVLRICREVRNLVPFSWFYFEVVAGDQVGRTWRAGEDGLLEDGTSGPAAGGPMPSLQRRVSWRLVERVLETGGRKLARLRLWCDPRLLDPESLRLLDLLLSQATTSVERTMLGREARQDALTGLALRRVFETELAGAFEECHQHGEGLAVVMADLDHFKAINDTFGHAAGDHALVEVGRLVARSARDSDLCCRYGGEELAILLPRTDGPTALRIAERLRHQVEQGSFRYGEEHLPVTLSAGVAAFPDTYVDDPQQLVRLADTALYAAKWAGRNRCLLSLGAERCQTVYGEIVKPAASRGTLRRERVDPRRLDARTN